MEFDTVAALERHGKRIADIEAKLERHAGIDDSLYEACKAIKDTLAIVLKRIGLAK